MRAYLAQTITMALIYDTNRLMLMLPTRYHLDGLLDYHTRNKDFLEIWEPERPHDFYTLKYQKNWIKNEIKEANKLVGITFLLAKKDEPERLIGAVRLSNILYGNFCSAFLGYRLDKDEINKGYMTEAVKKVLSISFNELYLHRIEASVIPSNIASKTVLKKAGFNLIGTSSSYLQINGKWQPHELYEYVNPYTKEQL